MNILKWQENLIKRIEERHKVTERLLKLRAKLTEKVTNTNIYIKIGIGIILYILLVTYLAYLVYSE